LKPENIPDNKFPQPDNINGNNKPIRIAPSKVEPMLRQAFGNCNDRVGIATVNTNRLTHKDGSGML